MDPDAIALFRALAERSQPEREEYYAHHNVAAPVRAEIESLLRSDPETKDRPPQRVAALAAHALNIFPAGAAFGPYRIVRGSAESRCT